MKLKNILPVALFCFVFLIYTLYFVKVVNTTTKLEPNAIANTIKRAMKNKESVKNLPPAAVVQEVKVEAQKINVPPPLPPPAPIPEPEVKPLAVEYVNFEFLNVRKSPTILSPLVEKIYKNAAVEIYAYPKTGWAEVKTASGLSGFVATKYLSGKAATEATMKAPPGEPSPVQDALIKVPIISYHHITDMVGKYPQDLTLPVVNFLAQLDYLVANNISAMTFYDLQDLSGGTKTTAGKSVILTFDDGYADQYEAAQHLNGKGFKGVFFIITEKIGTPGYLDWRQVKKMRSWGMEIGSHGVKSGDLVASTEFFITDELERSKRLIEQQLGESVLSFAYPSGRYNSKVLELTKKAGYRFARSIENGSQYKSSQFLKLPVLRVYSPAGARQFKAWLGS